jgi:hypothetical protein
MSSDNSSSECAKQIKNFEKHTGTSRDEWQTSDLKDNTVSIDPITKRPYYEFSDKDTEDYTEITPFFDYLGKDQSQRLAQLKQEHETNRANEDRSSGKWWHSCQYCGHGIIHPFKIKNVTKKLKMVIGSHCVKGFENVDPFTDLIKKRNEKTLRNAMKGWIQPICNQIWTDERLAERVYLRDGVKKCRPKTKFRNYAGFLKALDVDSMTYKELKDAFRKADNYEFIKLPVYVEEIIHPRRIKEKSGLDEFFWS